MTISLNSSHPLSGNVISLIGVDPSTSQLVDLVRSGVTFTKDAGAIVVDTSLGKGIKCAGSGVDSVGFGISPPIILNAFPIHEVTTLIVIDKMTGAGSNGSQPCRLPTSSPNAMCVSFDIGNNAIGINAGTNNDVVVTKASPDKILTDNTYHSLVVRQWHTASGWTGLQGDLFVDGVATTAAITNALTGNASTDMNISSFGKSFASSWQGNFVWLVVFNKKLTAAEISELHTGLAAGNVFSLVSGTTPVGSVPVGTTNIGTISTGTTTASVPFTYSLNDQTGFEYRLNGGSIVTVSGGTSPISLTGLTSNTTYTVEVRATNVTGAGTWSASKSFTTTALSDTTNPVLSGTISVSGISSSGYTLSWSAGTDNVAVTGYEVQINSGGYVDNGSALTKVVSGRTAGSTDTVYVRAYDAAGNRSTALSTTVNLTALSVGNIPLTDALVNNTGTKLTNATGIKAVIVRDSDFAPITTASALSTNASGILSTISSSLIVAGTVYRVVIKLSDGGVGVSSPITAV